MPETWGEPHRRRSERAAVVHRAGRGFADNRLRRRSRPCLKAQTPRSHGALRRHNSTHWALSASEWPGHRPAWYTAAMRTKEHTMPIVQVRGDKLTVTTPARIREAVAVH